MVDKTQVYTIKYDVSKALENLKKLEKVLLNADKMGKDVLRGVRLDPDTLKGVKSLAAALKPVAAGASPIKAGFDGIADASTKAGNEFEAAMAKFRASAAKFPPVQEKVTQSLKKTQKQGEKLDQMMARFSKKSTLGQEKIKKATDKTTESLARTDKALRRAMAPKGERRKAQDIRAIAAASGLASQSITGLAAKLSLLIGVGAGVRSVVSDYKEFDAAVFSAAAKFSRLNADLKPGTEAFKNFKKELREAGLETEHSAAGVARAADFWAKAGKSLEQTKAVLPITLDFASANQNAEGAMLDVAEAGDILSDALGQFGLNAEDSTKLMENTALVSDVMSAGANRANVSATELFAAYRDGGPAMTAVGQDIVSATAPLLFLADAGIKGAKAGTQLKIALASLNAPSRQQQKILDKLNVSVKDSKGNFRGLTNILLDITKATSGMGTSEKYGIISRIIGREGSSAFVNLLAQGGDKLEKLIEEIRKSSGERQRLAEYMRQSASAQIERFKQKITDLGFQIIENTGIFDRLTAAMDKVDWKKVSEVVEKDIIPALITAGKVFTNTIIPALQNAYRTISTVLSPVLKVLSVLFGDLSKQGNGMAETLGNLISLWVAYRAAMMASKATGIISWFVDLVKGAQAASAAQVALNTSTTATNVSLGESVKAFGLLRSASAIFAAGMAGWAVGTIIHETLIDPLAKAVHELNTLKQGMDELNNADLSKRSLGVLKADAKDLEKAEKLVEKTEKTLDLASAMTGMGGMGAMGAGFGFAPKRKREMGEVKELQSKVGEEIERREIPLRRKARLERVPEGWESPMPMPMPQETGLGQWSEIFVKTQKDYADKTLALLAKKEAGQTTQHFEIGPTTINVEAKGTSIEAVQTAVSRGIDQANRQQRENAKEIARGIGPSEI